VTKIVVVALAMEKGVAAAVVTFNIDDKRRRECKPIHEAGICFRSYLHLVLISDR
jgi:hypothetical protein